MLTEEDKQIIKQIEWTFTIRIPIPCSNEVDVYQACPHCGGIQPTKKNIITFIKTGHKEKCGVKKLLEI